MIGLPAPAPCATCPAQRPSGRRARAAEGPSGRASSSWTPGARRTPPPDIIRRSRLRRRTRVFPEQASAADDRSSLMENALSPIPARGHALAAVSLLSRSAAAGCSRPTRSPRHRQQARDRHAGRRLLRPLRAATPAQRARRRVDRVRLDLVGPLCQTGLEGLDDRVCKLHLGADQRGRINRVEATYDAPASTAISRCREIFAAG